MSSSRLKSEEYYRERVVSDSLLAATKSSTSSSSSQQQQQQLLLQQHTEDASEHEDVFGPPPLPKSTDLRPKSKVASLFDDSDSGDDLFASASPSSRSLKSSERTPSRAAAVHEPPAKRKGLFDDEDDLFAAPRDAPDVDLFGAAPVKNLSKVGAGLFDDVDDPSGAGLESEDKSAQFDGKTKSEDKSKSSLFDDKPKSKSTVNSLFSGEGSLFGDGSAEKVDSLLGAGGEDKKAPVKKPESRLFNEPAKVEKAREKKSMPKGLFEDLDDSEDSNLFGKSSKPIVTDKAATAVSGSSKSLFDDTSDSDLFAVSKSDSVKQVEKVADNIFGDSKSSSELFSSRESTVSEPKAEKAEPPKSLFAEEAKTAKPKRLNTSIFDDSDDDDDLFGGSSFTKKISDKKVSSIFGEDDSAKEMEEDKKSEVAESEKKTDAKKVPSDESNEVESKKFISKKVSGKENSLFDDDDDEDDLFGDKKKKSSTSEKPNQENKPIKSDAAIKAEGQKAQETKANTNSTAKPDVASKKAIFAEIQQKLEKHKLGQSEKQGKSESSVVDGAASSKREPPRTLKLQTTLSTPDPEESTKDQQAAKKPIVSGKIKNLQGKVGGLKLFSPTDTPPLFRKNLEENSSANNEEESETPTIVTADQASSGASTPSLPSGDSSPHTSGTNSRTRDSPSLKSDNTELAVSFDEPVRSETLASTSKSRARIQVKRRPQSRQARQEALRHSGIDFDVIDASDTSPVNQLNGNATDAHEKVDRLQPLSRLNQTEGSSRLAVDSAHIDDRSEMSVSRNTTTNLLSPSTDEEDLFDVPPDLPEDPKAKEDALFGRAPILSPIEPIGKPKLKANKEDGERKSHGSHIDEQRRRRESIEEEKKELKDPLRDESHDPLKDPSQLFAFVTKTPSPDKSKGLLVNEDDDSLFSSSFKSSEKTEKKSKPALDLFVDEDEGSSNDLFSSSKEKVKKSLKDTKIDLFDDDALEDDDSLFGSASKKTDKTNSKKSSPGPSAAREVQNMAEKTDIKSTKPTVQDIFNSSSDEDDIFSSNKKIIPKKKATSLFDDDHGDIDDNDIFGKSKSSPSQDIVVTPDSGRPVVKKAVTRDLKKTAEKIVEDPLSMLQND